MTTIAIVADNPGGKPASFRAIAGQIQSVGRTAGEALDAVTAKLGEHDQGTILVVQRWQPDAFFTTEQRQRLQDLMTRWRQARDQRAIFSADEQAELEALVEAETSAAAARAASLLPGLSP